jgi:hypothetical protein
MARQGSYFEACMIDLLDTLADHAGGTEVLDFGWGVAVGRAFADGWRVIPPMGQEAADRILADLYPADDPDA